MKTVYSITVAIVLIALLAVSLFTADAGSVKAVGVGPIMPAEISNPTVVIGEVTLIKTANPTEVPEPGGWVTYTYTIENTGTLDVTIDSLTDDQLGDLNGKGTCSLPQTIAPLNSYTCEVTTFVTGIYNPGSPTLITNNATASCTDNMTTALSDDDFATVTILPVDAPSPVLLWSYNNTTDDITDIATGILFGGSNDDVAAIDAPPENDTLHAIPGNSTDPATATWTLPIDGYSVAIGDIDNDSVNEIVAHSASDATIKAYESDNTLIWSHDISGFSDQVADIEIGDFNGDNYNDVVFCAGNRFGFRLGNEQGWGFASYSDKIWLDLALGDLDEIAGLELAMIGTSIPGTLYVRNYETFHLQWEKPISGRAVEIGDVTGNGVNEVVAGANDGYVYVYSYNGTLLYSFFAGSPVTDVELGELDGNEENGLEITCITDGSSAGTTLYALQSDESTISEMWQYPMAWSTDYYGESIAIGDIDRDYKNEVVACSSIAYHYVYAFDGIDSEGDGLGDPVWAPYIIIDEGINIRITDLELGDFDGDGDQDVVFGTTDNGSDPTIYAITAEEPTATGTGIAHFDADPSTLENLTPLGLGEVPPGMPDYEYPHGFFSFDITGLEPGQTATVTITLPDPVPVGTKWVKWWIDEWIIMDIGDDDGDNVITIELTDGGLGDNDLLVNGMIDDPGAPGFPKSGTPPETEFDNEDAVGGYVGQINKTIIIVPLVVLTVLIMIGGVTLFRRKAHS